MRNGTNPTQIILPFFILGLFACTTTPKPIVTSDKDCFFCGHSEQSKTKPIDWDALVQQDCNEPVKNGSPESKSVPPLIELSALQIGAFPIPDNLSRRALFWHKVYSRYSINDYILHLAEYPEVVLETASAGELGGARKAQSHLSHRKYVYRKLLMDLHRHRVSPKDLAAAARLAGAMAHVSDRNKYYKAALSIRIQRGQKEYIEKGLAMVHPYVAHIEAAFVAQDLPGELAYVAFVESSFNLNAVSKVGASGVYQLMPAVARSYMRVTDPIDERRDPIKSAQVAARIMRSNFDLLGDWPLAVTAYNHGANGVKRAATAARSRDLVTINERYHARSFGFASRNFYTEFLGVLMTLKEYEKKHPEMLPKSADRTALVFSNYKVPVSMPVNRLLHSVNVSREALAGLNPDLSRTMIRNNGTIPRGYIMKLPAERRPTRTSLDGVKLLVSQPI